MNARSKLVRPTPDEDTEINRGIEQDRDNPEWTDADWAQAQPAVRVVPELVKDHQRRTRGPQKMPTRKLVSIRLDQAVLDRLRAGGPGWQRRANDILAAATEPTAARDLAERD